MSSTPLHQAYFISITDNGNQGFGQEFFLLTFGPGFGAPAGAGLFGSAIWQQAEASDPFSYSLVSNPNQHLEPGGNSPPEVGQYITLEHVGVAAGASLTINLLIQGEQSGETKKIVAAGLVEGVTFVAGDQGSTTPL